MIEYTAEIKAARMSVVAAALSGGALELFEGPRLIARVPLTSGTVEGAELSFGVAEGLGITDGDADRAQLVGPDLSPVATGLSVGVLRGDVRMDSTDVRAGQTVRIISAVLRHA